jgi:hypothetical protein
MIALVAALVLSAVDPCAPVEPDPAADAALAATYRAVAEGELRDGSPGTATIAYRRALALDPSDAASRRGLAALCSATAGPAAAFQRGLARMDAGDLAGAIAAFEEVRAARPDPSAALLEGVCRYERGDDAARALLREAEAAPAHRDTAELYLALVALRDGDATEAARLVDAAAEHVLAPVALDLSRLAASGRKLVISVLAESGWDSNAQLAPSGTPVGASHDAMGAVTATGVYRPLGESGPYLRASALYRQQARFGDLDYGGASGAAGWQLGTGRRGAVAEYDFDYRALGGTSFLTAHRLLAAGWLPVGRVVLGGSYLARFESYPDALYAPFSGTLQRADATASVPLGRRAALSLAYRVQRDAVERAELSWLEHGPAAELRWRLGRRLRAGTGAAVSFRGYDAVDATLGLARNDTYLDATALLEWDVATSWTVRLSVDARDALSNAPGFAYFRIAPTLGIAYVVGM